MRRRSVLLACAALVLAAAGLALVALRRPRGAGDEVRARLSAVAVLGSGDTAGFQRAWAPRPFVFPADHGPHPGFRNEWWYFTGNLEGPDGRRFGYELTFFRSALAATAPTRPSEWAARDVYMAHFAITDAGAGRFLARDRFERGAVGLAGAAPADDGWRVWVDDWRAASSAAEESVRGDLTLRETTDARTAGHGDTAPPGRGDAGTRGHEDTATQGNRGTMIRGNGDTATRGHGDRAELSGFWPIQLVARDSGMALALTLGEGKPPVPQGEHGLSRKGPEPGNASYYYSLTRMPTSGWVESGGRRYRVTGESWMDREWSTSALGPDEVGWDWFALQLSDGRELMLYRIRRRDGSISPFSAGTLVGRDGQARPLTATEMRVDALATWTSPRDGARYPGRWRLRVPSAALDLEVRPVVADQELSLAVRYWEGAVDVAGTAGGRPVVGRGYVELTGYADPAAGRPRAPGG